MTISFPGQRRPAGARTRGEAKVLLLHPVGQRVGGDAFDRRAGARFLDGRASYGAGHDNLIAVLADACAPASPLELRGEDDALAAFHAARSRQVLVLPTACVRPTVSRRQAALNLLRPNRSGVGRAPARRVAPDATAAPVIAPVLAVAASAAIAVLAYTASLGMPAGSPPATGRVMVPAQAVPAPSATVDSVTTTAAGRERQTQPRASRDQASGPGATPRQTTGAGSPTEIPDSRIPNSVFGGDAQDVPLPAWSPSPSPSLSADGSPSSGSTGADGHGATGGTNPGPTSSTGSTSGGSTSDQAKTATPVRPKRKATTDRTHRTRDDERTARSETTGGTAPSGSGTAPDGESSLVTGGSGGAGGTAGVSGSGTASPTGEPVAGVLSILSLPAVIQALPLDSRRECVAWTTARAGGDAVPADLADEIEALLAGRKPALVDLLCGDLLQHTR